MILFNIFIKNKGESYMDNEIIGVIIVVAVILFMSIENNNKVLRTDISRLNKNCQAN